MPISVVKGQEKKWSAFQGNMTWNEAKTKCESIGMRLPTREELQFAPMDKWQKEASEKSEKFIIEIQKDPHRNTEVEIDRDEGFYWDSSKLYHVNSEMDEDFNKAYSDEELNSFKYSVRCIAGKEFQFKK